MTQSRPVEPGHVLKRRCFTWELEHLEACIQLADYDGYGFELRWVSSRRKVVRILRVLERR